MSRGPRINVGDCIYHVINRANGRATIFRSDADFLHFEYLLKEAVERFDMRLLAYTIMSNHWHLVLYPKNNGDLSGFMQWLTLTHTQQYRARTDSVGQGHLYQGRYKSFLIENDDYLLTVLKYVERNSVRAHLCKRTEEWKWGSGYRRLLQKDTLLSPPPFDLPSNYQLWINEPDKENDLKDLRQSVNKSRPYGAVEWTERMVEQFGMEMVMRRPGRPRNGT